MSGQTQEIPQGYRANAKGHLVPEQSIKQIDLMRDELVEKIVTEALAHRSALEAFKREALADIEAFITLSYEEYAASVGGEKGNVSLLSFDGRYKVQITVAEYMTFDERLGVAKSLVDECLIEWSEGANANLRTIVTDAFQVDHQGRYNRGRILVLRRLAINDARWVKAMEAIADSQQVQLTKSYVRFFERDAQGKYQPILLDLAKV